VCSTSLLRELKVLTREHVPIETKTKLHDGFKSLSQWERVG
jgi:hypothetical protein